MGDKGRTLEKESFWINNTKKYNMRREDALGSVIHMADRNYCMCDGVRLSARLFCCVVATTLCS